MPRRRCLGTPGDITNFDLFFKHVVGGFSTKKFQQLWSPPAVTAGVK